MAVNASEIIDTPWETIFGTFTDLLGSGFYLIPVSFLAIALYMKTKDVMVVGVWLIASGITLAGGNIFAGYIEMSTMYTIVVAIGVTGVVMEIYFMRR